MNLDYFSTTAAVVHLPNNAEVLVVGFESSLQKAKQIIRR
jgi:hypothetical protein